MTIMVTDAAGSVTSAMFSLQICSVNLIVQFNSLSPGFVVPVATPVPVVVTIFDGCGIPADNSNVVSTFSNGDPPISLLHSGAPGSGQFNGTWLPRNPQSSKVTVTVSANLITPFGATNVTGVGSINGTVGNTGPPFPVIDSGGVVSAISYQGGAPVAIGSYVAIFGQGFSESTTAAASYPLPTSLGGTSVTIGSLPAPVLFVSPGQINVIVSYDTASGAQPVIVSRSGLTSSPSQVTVAAAQPVIISNNQSGRGQGVIVDVNGQIVGPGNAAKAGDVVVVYCSGLGPVSPPVPAGSPISVPSQTVYPVRFQIGGVDALLSYTGLAGGYAQLYQVNATVPVGVHGDAVPAELLVDVSGTTVRSGSAVTMAVQ